jgi:hypothetical protein
MALPIGLYAKALGTMVVTGFTATIAALADNSIAPDEWLTIAIATLLSTGVVWAVPSTPAWMRHYGKAGVAGIVAFLSSIAVGLTDGPGGSVEISQAEWLTAAVALLTALGVVAATSNAAASDPVMGKKIVPVSHDEKVRLVNGNAAGRGVVLD